MRRTAYIRYYPAYKPLEENVLVKFHPKRFPGMSDQMMAMVCFFIGMKHEPEIAGMVRKSDGNVYAKYAGEVEHRHMMGKYDEIQRNWRYLISLPEVGLTDAEYKWCEGLLTMIRPE